MAQLNTLIVLRNDESAKWEAVKDTAVLLKGEPGLEFSENGKVRMKIGDGETPWVDLPYFGGEECNVFQVTGDGNPANDVTAIEAAVSTAGKTANVGDQAIVKYTIIEADSEKGIDAKYSHTAYVYDGEWKAMDGNYSAKNVYFDSDLTATSPIGIITQEMIDDNNGSVTHTATGKNVQEVLSSLMAEEANPTVDTPSVSLSVSGGSGEVGTSYTLPTATITIDDVGSYTYGSKDTNNVVYGSDDTGVTFAIGDVTLSEGSDNTISNTAVMVDGSTLKLKATGDNTLYGDSSVSYTFSATAEYTASEDRIPVTNLGNKVESLKIADGSVTIDNKIATFTGWRKMFMGTVTDASAEITSSVIRGLTLINKQASKSAQTFTAPVGATKIIVAFPATYSTATPKFEYFTMSWEDFAGFVKADSVQVADARGGENGLKEYTVYTFTHSNPSGFEADTQFRVTLK